METPDNPGILCFPDYRGLPVPAEKTDFRYGNSTQKYSGKQIQTYVFSDLIKLHGVLPFRESLPQSNFDFLSTFDHLLL